MNGFKGILAPGEGTMVLAEDTRHGDVILVLEIIHNEKTGVFLIGFLDLLFLR